MKTLYTRFLQTFLLVGLLVPATLLKSNATKHVVTVANFVFTPSSLTINLGDTMEWVFVSGTHTTTSTTIPAGADYLECQHQFHHTHI
jgi:plastocyanin